MAGRSVRSSSGGSSRDDARDDAHRTSDGMHDAHGTRGRSVSSGAGSAHNVSQGRRRGRTVSSHRDGTAATPHVGRQVSGSATAASSSASSARTGNVKRSVKPKSSPSAMTGEHRFPLEPQRTRQRVASNAGARAGGARTVTSGTPSAAKTVAQSKEKSTVKSAGSTTNSAKDSATSSSKRGGTSLVARMRALLPQRGRQTAQVRRARIVDEPISRSEPGSFVDANNMHSEDIVAKTLRQTAGTVGVATRPKVVDFTKRQKERRRANLRQTVTHVAAAVGAIAVVAAIVWLLFFSPVLRLSPERITVSGANQWVSERQIMTIARGQAGKSLLLVSDAAVEEQLSSIPGVSSARAAKRFPNGLDVSVEAQRPAAMLRVKGGDTLTAVDNKARVLNAVDAKSAKGIPVIDVTSVDDAVKSRALQSAVVILDAFPEGWRKDVTAVSAPTQDSITTTFANGIIVVWGDATDLKLKMAIADKIMNDPKVIGDKKQINVSAPNRPIIK